MGIVVFPGESIEKEKKFRVGPGLIAGKSETECIAQKVGLLETANNTIYVDNSQQRYLPALGDPVIGIVMGKMGEGYKVDIGGPFNCYLESTAFEGATKRNKPTIANGGAVFGRITLSNRDMEPEMVCFGASGKSEGYGDLPLEGHIIKIGLSLARRLLNPNHPIISGFAEFASFDLAVGLNGIVWIKGDSIKTTALISNAILKSDNAPISKIQNLIQKAKEMQQQ